MNVKHVCLVLVVLLAGCQAQLHPNIELSKSLYVEQQYKVQLGQQLAFKNTVLLTIMRQNQVTNGHGVFVKINEKVFILTNNHVIYDVKSNDIIRVTTHDLKEFFGTVVYQDPAFDLALIEPSLKMSDYGVDLNTLPTLNEGARVFRTQAFLGNKRIVFGTYLNKEVIDISNANELVANVQFEVIALKMLSEEGISGAPIFNEQFVFVGLIFAGNLELDAQSRVYVISLNDIALFTSSFIRKHSPS